MGEEAKKGKNDPAEKTYDIRKLCLRIPVGCSRIPAEDIT